MGKSVIAPAGVIRPIALVLLNPKATNQTLPSGPRVIPPTEFPGGSGTANSALVALGMSKSMSSVPTPGVPLISDCASADNDVVAMVPSVSSIACRNDRVVPDPTLVFPGVAVSTVITARQRPTFERLQDEEPLRSTRAEPCKRGGDAKPPGHEDELAISRGKRAREHENTPGYPNIGDFAHRSCGRPGPAAGLRRHDLRVFENAGISAICSVIPEFGTPSFTIL